MNTTASAHPVTETPSKPGFMRKFFSFLGKIAEKGKHIFSITALVVVLIWSLCELQGWHPNATMDKVVPGFIIVLMIFELWKTTAIHQLNKKAYLLDLATQGSRNSRSFGWSSRSSSRSTGSTTAS